ncbi:hypothetical protein ACFLQN_00050 [Candidatus Aenigmatarchaeota archaeon]
MKGIIRIFEAIIASVILLTTMSFFFTSQFLPETEDYFLPVEAHDLMGALYVSQQLENYLINNDKESLMLVANDTLPPTTGFSFGISGTPGNNIYVACNCTDTELVDVRRMLNITLTSPWTFNFIYKERDITIHLEQIDMEDSIPDQTNIIIFYTYQDLSPYRDIIDTFLESGGSLIMISNLDQTQTENEVMNEIFGLEWNNLPPASPGTFYEIDDPVNTSFKIYSYFTGTTQDYEDILIEGTFENNIFDELSRVSVNNRTIIQDNNGDNSFVKIKDNIADNGKGKSVWLAEYTIYQEDDLPNINKTYHVNDMLRATIMWASSDYYNMDYPVEKPTPDKKIKTSVLSAGHGTNFDPFEAFLTTWRIFFF